MTTIHEGNVSLLPPDQDGSVQAACPKPFSLVQGLCLYFSLEPMNWTQSDELCQSNHGRLVEIENAEKMEVIKEKMTGLGQLFWMGLTDIATEGSWVWQSSKQPAKYTNWNAGEPSSGNGKYIENCALIYEGDWGRRLGEWNDVQCAQSSIFALCEKL